jgi:hypothetical protein
MRVRIRKTPAAFVADDEIDVALPIPALDVGETVPLVGQRAQRLHEQAQALDADRQLAGLRLEQRASAPTTSPTSQPLNSS